MRRAIRLPLRLLAPLLALWCAPAPAGSPVASILIDGFEDPLPMLRYRFEGDGSNSGTLAGYGLNVVSSTFGAGKTGQGLTFGQGGFAQVSGMRGVLGTFARATVAFWMFETVPISGQAFWDDNNRSVAPYGGVQLAKTGSTIGVCVSTTTNSFLDGTCSGFTAPSIGTWHHWIVRYSGTGTGPGQGGPTEIYVDDVLMLTRANDASNNPVFNNTGMPDVMTIGGSNATMDELTIFNTVFTRAEQCTLIIGGVWTGSSCTLP